MTWISNAAVERLRDVADFPVPPGDRYEIVETLARGGMGTVYRARDRELDRVVAVKVLSATAHGNAAVRIQEEARVVARLEHPGIVPVYDIGVLEDGRVFYVMKLVQGPRLDEHVAARPLAERLRLFTRICEPVAFAHAHGVVHRDLKPDNIMIGAFGEVLVMDWGIAQVGEISDLRFQISDLNTPIVAGTRGYMPPEQERGESVDARADVYALGGILHFLLSGAPPGVAPLRGPRPLQAVCLKARAPAVGDRYDDVAAMSTDVDRFLAGDSVTALPESATVRVARVARKNRVAITIVVTYLAARYLIAWLAP